MNAEARPNVATSHAGGTRSPELDGFRGLAILLVLVGHFLFFPLRVGGRGGCLALAGVSLFFALSGFLITSLLCREDERTGRIDLGRFYVRRGIRLLPAAWLFIACVALLNRTGALNDDTWGGIGASLFYLRNVFGRGTSLAHLWSLSLEEQFYLVWPLLFVFLPRRRLEVAVGLSVAVAVVRLAHAHQGDDTAGIVYQRPWFRFDACMVGCALALCRQRFQLGAPRSALVRLLLHPATLGAGLVLSSYAYVSWDRPAAWSLTLQTWCSVLLLHRCMVPGGNVYRAALRSAPLRALGRVSYSVYLWQQLFLVTRTPDWGVLRRPGIDLLCALATGVLAYVLVERPCLALKDRVGPRGRVVPDPASLRVVQR